jgi:hypothetical protein
MAFIGNTPTTQGFIPAVDFFSGNASTTAFTLSRPVASVAQVQAVVENVPQKPGDAYTISGNTITFTSAPPSGTNNIYVYYTSPITQVIAPSQGTVGTAALATGLDVSAGNVSYTGTLTGGTGVVNLGSGQVYKDSSGNVGVGVVPSAWDTTNSVKAIQTPAGAFWNYANNNVYLAEGYFFNGSNRIYSASSIGVAEYSMQNGTHIWASAASGTAGGTVSLTERARIDTSGVLCVGTTGLGSNGTRMSVSGANRVVRILGSTEGEGAFMVDKTTNTSTTSQVFIQFSINNQATANGQINANGASQAAFGSFSDRRLKENIVDLEPQLANICALRPVEFDYIESEGGGHQTGFVAQEMQEIYPDAVGERAPDGMLTVTGWSKTEARLVKAIQEQQALIQSLTARIAALEGAQ